MRRCARRAALRSADEGHPRARAASVAALTLLLCGAGAALAQSTGDTADLKTTFVQRLDGAHTGDDAGDRVANAGDVNRDGREDLIVGAYTADAGGRKDAGAAYLVTASNARKVKLGSGGARASSRSAAAARATRSGRWSPASATSTATGAPTRPSAATSSTPAGARRPARCGWSCRPAAARPSTCASPARGLVRIDGSDEEAELDPAASAGDFNGDGIGDLVVGETGAAYVILGRRDFRAVDLGDPGAGVAPDLARRAGGLRLRGRGRRRRQRRRAGRRRRRLLGGRRRRLRPPGHSQAVDAGAAGSGSYDIGAGEQRRRRPRSATRSPASATSTATGAPTSRSRRPTPRRAASAAPASSRSTTARTAPSRRPTRRPPAQGMRIFGAGNDDRAGYTVAGRGDLDGDGRPEVARRVVSRGRARPRRRRA